MRDEEKYPPLDAGTNVMSDSEAYLWSQDRIAKLIETQKTALVSDVQGGSTRLTQQLLASEKTDQKLNGAAVSLKRTEELPLPPNAPWKGILADVGAFESESIKQGRAKGVPEIYICHLAVEFIRSMMAREKFIVIAEFMRTNKIGTAEQQAHFDRLAVTQKTHRDAERDLLEKWDAEEALEIHLSENATMADFSNACMALGSAEGRIMIDRIFSLPGDIVEQYMALREDPVREASISVREFFAGIDNVWNILGIEWKEEEEPH